MRKQQRLGGHSEVVRIQTDLGDLRIGQEVGDSLHVNNRAILFRSVYSEEGLTKNTVVSLGSSLAGPLSTSGHPFLPHTKT